MFLCTSILNIILVIFVLGPAIIVNKVAALRCAWGVLPYTGDCTHCMLRLTDTSNCGGDCSWDSDFNTCTPDPGIDYFLSEIGSCPAATSSVVEDEDSCEDAAEQLGLAQTNVNHNGEARNNDCRWSDDNECDEPSLCSPGTDCSDCSTCGLSLAIATGSSDRPHGCYFRQEVSSTRLWLNSNGQRDSTDAFRPTICWKDEVGVGRWKNSCIRDQRRCSFRGTCRDGGAPPDRSTEPLLVRGACQRQDKLNTVYVHQGSTSGGYPYYMAAGPNYLYYDKRCDGEAGTTGRWIFDTSKPSTTAWDDLDYDNDCVYTGRIISTSMTPPVGRNTWQMDCDGSGFDDRDITITARGAYTCMCDAGFDGYDCENNIDDCAGISCSGNGACIDGINTYTCDCEDGFKGTHCESIAVCGKGQHISSSGKMCLPCPSNTFMDSASHENEECTPQTRCAIGEKISSYSIDAAATCEFCSAGMYQDKDGHRKNLCKSQPTCSPGEAISASSRTSLLTSVQRCRTMNDCFGVVATDTTCDGSVDGYSTFSDLSEAIQACVADDDCKGVGDGWCDGAPFTLCKNMKDSTIKSCVYTIAESDMCLNDGTCVDGVNAFTCACNAGFTGDRCEIKKNQCLDSSQIVKEADCQAYAESIGKESSLTICVGSTCAPLGCYVFTDGAGEQTVWWNNDKSGPCTSAKECVLVNACSNLGSLTGLMSKKVLDVYIVATDQAGNDQACVDSDADFTCECNPGFAGERCQTNMNECIEVASETTDITCDGKVDGYSKFSDLAEATKACAADDGCKGVADIRCDGAPFTLCKNTKGSTIKSCVYQKENFKTNTCSNHGRCVDGDNTFTCECNPGFAGESCQTNLNECIEVAAETTDMTCDEKVDGYSTFSDLAEATKACAADDGCKGVGDGWCDGAPFTLCKNTKGSTIKSCVYQKEIFKTNTCSNHGRCVDGDNTFTCECNPGFAGESCQTNMNECFLESGDEAAVNYCATKLDLYTGFSKLKHAHMACAADDDCEAVVDEGCNGEPNDGPYSLCASVRVGTKAGTCTYLKRDYQYNICTGNGDCIDGANSYKCACTGNFVGNDCDGSTLTCTKGEHYDRYRHECIGCPENTYNDNDEPHREEECSTHKKCQQGELITWDTKTAKREQPGECRPCPPNTYNNEAGHRKDECTEQTMCSAGLKISADSATSQRTCAICTSGHFQDADNHRETECKAQPECKAGEYITPDDKTAARTCEACPDNTYQSDANHRHLKDLCTAQPKCSAGEYITPDDKTAARTCEACPDNTYQSDANHRHLKDLCTAQPKCSAGEYITPDDKTAARTCEACPDNTYQSDTNHRDVDCLEQPLCHAGERAVNVSLRTKLQCLPCLSNTYNSQPNHTDTKCSAQPTCDSGQYISARSTTGRQTCSSCNDDRFQNAAAHRIEVCIAQPVCSPGKYYFDPATKKVEGTCFDCINGKYQNLSNHRARECFQQPSCRKGERAVNASLTTRLHCILCASNTFNDQGKHAHKQCKVQPTCSSGQYISPHNSTSRRQCHNCKDGTFQNATDHRIEECLVQPFCNFGEYYYELATNKSKGVFKNTKGVCIPCNNATYQNKEKHRIPSCSVQEVCDPGFKISAASTTVKQTCTPCELSTYIADFNHRIEKCAMQPNCSSGQFISENSTTSRQQCEDCRENTFQNASAHRISDCIRQPFCGLGEEYTHTNKSTAALCRPCNNGTYQDQDSHRIPSCSVQEECIPGFKISAASPTLRQVCTPCEPNTYIAEFSHRIEKCTMQQNCSSGQILSGNSTTDKHSCILVDTSSGGDPTDANVLYIVIAASAGSLVFALIIGCCIYTRSVATERATLDVLSNHLEEQNRREMEAQVAVLEALLEEQAAKRAETAADVNTDTRTVRSRLETLATPRLENFELDSSKLSFENSKVLGSGNFGLVQTCHLDGIEYAAKVVKIKEQSISQKHRQDRETEILNLRKEAGVMMLLKKPGNPYIVEMVGIVSTGNLAVVISLEANGDLKNFLKDNRISDSEKMRWAHNIADGMLYISNLHIVHRDLAARNVMVSDRRICKVADFGLSRLMKTKKRTEQDATDGDCDSSDDYYAATPGQLNPIKWTAPEGIFHNRFSTASDAWSYAITIVEILQNGNNPYTVPETENLDNTAVKHYLKKYKNFIHPKPADCSGVLYSLLTDCWKREPVERPSFEDILTRLERIIKESSQFPTRS